MKKLLLLLLLGMPMITTTAEKKATKAAHESEYEQRIANALELINTLIKRYTKNHESVTSIIQMLEQGSPSRDLKESLFREKNNIQHIELRISDLNSIKKALMPEEA